MDASTLREIEALREAPLSRLREKHRELFGEEPRSKHKDQLFRRMAWRLQALAEGGLSQRALQRADVIANEADLRIRKRHRGPDAIQITIGASLRRAPF
jgi:Protein of unknown function (DUF2924)